MVSGKSGHAFKQANCIKVVETFLSAGFGGPVLSQYTRLRFIYYSFLFYDWEGREFGWGLGGVTLIEPSGHLSNWPIDVTSFEKKT